MAPLTWLITGASSGFGYELTLHVLAAGHKAIGTVRNRTKSSDSVNAIEKAGGNIMELDVTDTTAVPGVAASASALYGTIDVLVNNAGYALLGAVEDMTDTENALQFETNLFGPLRLIRALLPGMRNQKSGIIVNISSIAGLDGLASCGMYAASKFALEGLSESLAREVEPFNIRVLIVEPGMFRTNLLAACQITKTGITEPYRMGPVQTVLDKFMTSEGKQTGDPKKAASRIFEVLTGEGMAGGLKGEVLRLPLGPDCVTRMEAKIKNLETDLHKTREVAFSTDF